VRGVEAPRVERRHRQLLLLLLDAARSVGPTAKAYYLNTKANRKTFSLFKIVFQWSI